MGILSLLCVSFCLFCFFCTVTDFSAAKKGSRVTFCMRVSLLPDRSSPLLKVKGQGHRRQKTRLELRSLTRLAYEWYAPLLLRRRRASAFAGGRGVISAVAYSEARNCGRRRRLRPYGGICVSQTCLTHLLWFLATGSRHNEHIQMKFGV